MAVSQIQDTRYTLAQQADHEGCEVADRRPGVRRGTHLKGVPGVRRHPPGADDTLRTAGHAYSGDGLTAPLRDCHALPAVVL